MGMPVGWRFKPSDEFLIQVLHRIASGLSVNLSPHIVDLDLYGPGKEPWNLFSADQDISELFVVNDPEEKVREKFVFTRVSRIGAHNISRIAGAGTWMDKSKIWDVEVGGYVMGRHKTLTYEYCGGDGAAAGKCFYSLHEYYLSDEALQKLEIPSFDYVVCRVMKDTSKSCRLGKKRKFDPLPLPKRSRQKVVEELGDELDVLLESVPEKAGPVVQEKEDDPVPEPEVIDSDPEDDSIDFDLFYQNTAADWKYLTETPMGSDEEPDLASIFPDPSRMWEGFLS